MILPHTLSDVPLVSVVICTYNREKYLSQTIDSVLEQEIDFQIEIIIGDDASTDNSKEILLQYQKKHPNIFTLVFQEQNQGVAKNWADLMKLVQGKYVALCDDDDYWHSTKKLQKQVVILEQNPQIGLVHTNYRSENITNKKHKEHKIRNKVKSTLIYALFEDHYTILNSSVVLRNSLIKQYVNLDDYINLGFQIQDWETWILIAKYTEFYHLNLSTVTYRYSVDSVTRPVDFDTLISKFEKDKIMYQYLCDKFPDDLVYDENKWQNYVNRILLYFSYLTLDYEKAQFYGKLLKDFDLRVFCSKNKLLFHSYSKFKKIKNRFHDITSVTYHTNF